MPTNTPLQSIVLTSTSSSVTFSDIDQSYTDLVLVTNVKGPTSNLESLRLRFNGDSGTNYSVTWMRGDGTSALVSALIAEMQGMRADLAAGKIAVNIDGQRMNAKIAANAVRNPIS
jgi:hypothetical protein